MHEQSEAYYSEIGRPSIDPELMIRMLIVGYCYGLRSERKLTQEVELHLAYRWFCRLDLDDKITERLDLLAEPAASIPGERRLRHIFERVVAACMAAGLVKGEGFAVDASVMEANASRYHGKAPDEIEWGEPECQTRAVKEYLAASRSRCRAQPRSQPLADLWLFVTPTKRRAVCAQPHLHATAAQAVLKNLGWRFCSMAKLVFGLNQSLDGYVDHQQFAPGPSLFRHFTEQVRDLTGSVYGRRMYEVMRYWDEDRSEWDAEELADFAAAWRSQPKWVVSGAVEVSRPQRHTCRG